MTNDELAAIEARVAVATPGPWEARSKGEFAAGREIGCEIAGNIHPGTSTPVCQLWPGFRWYEGDKEFVAHSRQDIPALVAEIRRLQNGIAKIEARWRAASEDTTFRSHYRGTMTECADALRDLLAGSVDEDALRAEIDKAFEGGKL